MNNIHVHHATYACVMYKLYQVTAHFAATVSTKLMQCVFLHCLLLLLFLLLLLLQCTFANNTATGAGGGAIYGNSTEPITVTNVLFQNNSATAAAGVGGTAYLAHLKGYVFDNSGFLASASGSYGGALYVSVISTYSI